MPLLTCNQSCLNPVATLVNFRVACSRILRLAHPNFRTDIFI